jgi:hypothetical protein
MGEKVQKPQTKSEALWNGTTAVTTKEHDVFAPSAFGKQHALNTCD